MKKTFLALAVAAMAASGANATVIYQQDGTKIDVDGRLALEVIKAKDKRTDVLDRGSRVRFRAFQELTGGYEALAVANYVSLMQMVLVTIFVHIVYSVVFNTKISVL